MNKKRMGAYIRNLRTSRGLSQERLRDELEKRYFMTVSVNAISSWEKGKTIPEVDYLRDLAAYFGVTVDELLEGEPSQECDFVTLYPDFSSSEFLERCDEQGKIPYTEISKKGGVIRKRFKELCLECSKGSDGLKNRRELLYILNRYALLEEGMNNRVFLRTLKDLGNQQYGEKELWWEIQKLFRWSDALRLEFNQLSDEGYIYEGVRLRMAYLEDWEKDLLLTTLQRVSPISFNPVTWSSNALKNYEKEHGKRFDFVQIFKDTIRFLIENGACINLDYMDYLSSPLFRTRVIDTLESAHDEVKKPFRVEVFDASNNRTMSYWVENNFPNYLLANQYYSVIKPLKELGFSFGQIIEMIASSDVLPGEVFLAAAKKDGADINRDINYIVADYYHRFSLISDLWNELRDKLSFYQKGYEFEREKWESELEKGNHDNTSMRWEWSGDETPDSYEQRARNSNRNKTLAQYEKGRLKKRTVDLLQKLDLLTQWQIQNDYLFRRTEE